MDLISEHTENRIKLKEFITNTNDERQFLFLSDVLKIIGFIVFLVYCILRIFFGLTPVSEPFDLLILGCGLISTPHILRIYTKNFKIRSKKNYICWARYYPERSLGGWKRYRWTNSRLAENAPIAKRLQKQGCNAGFWNLCCGLTYYDDWRYKTIISSKAYS